MLWYCNYDLISPINCASQIPFGITAAFLSLRTKVGLERRASLHPGRWTRDLLVAYQLIIEKSVHGNEMAFPVFNHKNKPFNSLSPMISWTHGYSSIFFKHLIAHACQDSCPYFSRLAHAWAQGFEAEEWSYMRWKEIGESEQEIALGIKEL